MDHVDADVFDVLQTDFDGRQIEVVNGAVLEAFGAIVQVVLPRVTVAIVIVPPANQGRCSLPILSLRAISAPMPVG